MPMAAAYLGYADDNSPFRDQVRTLLKNGKYEEQYSFLADVPKENYISYNGEEVYAIVPQSTQYAMKVESFDWDENANAMVRDTLYISQIWRYQSGMNAENAEDAVIRKVMVPL